MNKPDNNRSGGVPGGQSPSVAPYRLSEWPESLSKTPPPPTPMAYLCVLGGVAYTVLIALIIANMHDHQVHIRALAAVLLICPPILLTTYLIFSRWWSWSKLPDATREEIQHGRVFPPLEELSLTPPLRFNCGSRWIEFRADGLAVSKGLHFLSWAARNYPETPQECRTVRTGVLVLPWSEMEEVILLHDDEYSGRCWYALKLKTRPNYLSRKDIVLFSTSPPDPDILNAFRAIGRVPARIRCDIN